MMLVAAEQRRRPFAGVDRRGGFCTATRTFHSLRPAGRLPPEELPLTVAEYAFSLLSSSSGPPVPGRPALVDAATGIAVSYRCFVAGVRSLAGGLWFSLGLRPGDVALVVTPSRLDVPVLHFALMSIGVVVSPANPASTADEYAHQVRLSRPAVAFAAPEVAAKLPRHVSCVVIGSEVFRKLASADGGAAAPPAVAVKQSNTAALLYSSGTTGRVKAVAITHRNLIAQISAYSAIRETAAREAINAGRPTPPAAAAAAAVTLFPLPLFHVMGFGLLTRTVSSGETAVLMHRFDLAAAVRAVERYRVTRVSAAPSVLVALTKSEEARRRDLSSLLAIVVGGAPLGPEVAERFAAVFPNVQIIQSYGLTESTGPVASMAGPVESAAYGSAGKLAPRVEAKIIDTATGESLGPGRRGELWIRGPVVMKGYVGDAEVTAATITPDGWLKTGDLCYFNEDGFLYIVDRLKELIKYKGYQVPPAELEHILQSRPEIADAAVVPYPDEEAGQLPMAFVVRQPGTNLTEQQVMNCVAKHVAPYKKVRRVAFVTAIPKSPAGKILRRELAQQAVASRL
ncbi:4-coumarate--CoA ligase-like 6 [Oryza brachyantha]|uniref:4-coumarate--CoA ligase-like 6 n=1 Tax=Oryza brachyantha TaxID=4533 RepID=UPI001ADCA0D2|nr:4-coumarate--CoA ligase-like 6 [Oryza brachyantha]